MTPNGLKKVFALIASWAEKRIYGRIVLCFQAGKLTDVKLEQNLKVDEIANKTESSEKQRGL